MFNPHTKLEISIRLPATNRGAGTVSGQGGQRFLEKNSARSAENFFYSLPTLVISLSTLDFIAWVGKDPPAITYII